MTLGIDLSTQSVTLVVYENGSVKKRVSVNFGKELPQYNAPNGFIPCEDPLRRHADPLMWLDGLDMAMARLAKECDTAAITAVCADAQQHGTVYLNSGFAGALEALPGAGSLAEGLKDALARKSSPIWMDSATSAECRELQERFGERMQRDTGSPATERFAGPQCRKFAKDEPEAWAATDKVHLISSFLCSILCGAPAPVDVGDGAGTNLMNLNNCEWDEEICAFTAPGLLGKLPKIAKEFGKAGGLSRYFEKYGFKAGIPVGVCTGDNPASLVGCGAAQPGFAVLSLGTSDTLFAAMGAYAVSPQGYGHVFGNPLGGFMSLTCFKNGSLARDRVRSEAGADWKFFDETAFELTAPGNGGLRAFPYFEQEMTPQHPATGVEANFDFEAAAPEVRIRAIVEGQIANIREHSRWMGEFSTILVTGGASVSKGIRSVIADLFKAEVRTLEVTDSAALGAALLAARL